MKPKASFVIPAYNAEAYLSQTILSCREQSIKEIEIIIVNDGSSDGTVDLVNYHVKQDPRVILINLDKNMGRSAARNEGNRQAKSPFILVLDSDDIALKNRVKDTLFQFRLKNPDVVYGPFAVIDEHGNVLGNQKAGAFNKEVSMKRKNNFIGHSTMAYRKGVTMNVSYDEGEYSKLGLDDWKFQWDCILKGYKFGICATPLSQYRIYQLPNNSYGSTTEYSRDPKEVERLKNEYIAGIETQLAKV